MVFRKQNNNKKRTQKKIYKKRRRKHFKRCAAHFDVAHSEGLLLLILTQMKRPLLQRKNVHIDGRFLFYTFFYLLWQFNVRIRNRFIHILEEEMDFQKHFLKQPRIMIYENNAFD